MEVPATRGMPVTATLNCLWPSTEKSRCHLPGNPEGPERTKPNGPRTGRGARKERLNGHD
jgi:hypothetical protein